MPIPIPVELDRVSVAVAGDFLSSANALPPGWQRGISFNDVSCLTPTVMGECPACPPGLKDAQRAEMATFRPVSLINAVECSTFGGIDVQATASASANVTAGYALARELLTGQAATRDANPNALEGPNPSLQRDAMLIPGPTGPQAALGCLEQALADATGGRRGVILMGPEIANMLWMVLIRNGSTITTVSGTRVIIDAGFDGRAPIGDDSPGDDSPGDCIPWNTTGAPQQGDELYIYGTSAVWAGIGTSQMLGDVDRQNNTATARDERIALAAFTPCATFAVGSGIDKQC